MTALSDLIRAVEANDRDALWLRTVTIPDRQITNLIAAYDGSLDAALALHEAVIYPLKMGWDLWTSPEGYGCNIGRHDTAYADTPARAWLLAILRALEAQENTND